MTISGATRAMAAAAALTLTTLAMAGSAHGATQRGTTDPLVGAPTVGSCTTLTAKQSAARSDRSKTVDCATAHTAQVAGVVKLPQRLKFSTATTAQLFKVVAAKCGPEVDALLGRNAATRDSSAYSYYWFEPTKNQRAKGARWLSCSVALVKAAKLTKLPKTTAPFLPSGKLPDSVARCLTKAPFLTACSAGHAWRATGTFSVAGKYPGAKALNKKATKKCVSRVHSRTYRWTYQDPATWNLGHDHVVVCYTKTKG